MAGMALKRLPVSSHHRRRSQHVAADMFPFTAEVHADKVFVFIGRVRCWREWDIRLPLPECGTG